MTHRTYGTQSFRSQRGVALIMAMIFLLLATLLGVTAMSTTALGERMAGNMSNKNLAFQAAESALIAAETWIRSQINKPVFDPGNIADGLHLPSTTSTPVWDVSTGIWSSTDVVAYSGLSTVNTQPAYIIEDLGEVADVSGSLVLPGNYKSSGKNLFRITSRGTGGTDTAVATVQSVYEKRF